MLTVALTGHRPDKLAGYHWNPVRAAVRAHFKEVLLCLIGEHLIETGDARCEVLCGMAQGFDQDAACACVQAGVPFVAVIPFAGQESVWPEAAQREYRQILSRAARIVTLHEGEVRDYRRLLLQRNTYMMRRADVVVACHDGSQEALDMR